MTEASEVALLSATELISRYREGSLSPVQTTHAVFEQIERLNPRLNAFCWLDRDAALDAARESERRWRRSESLGPLDGVPISVKDLSLTRGWPTRRGSTLIAATGPWPDDAPCVARVREAGAVLIGKTTVPEFAAKGVTRSTLSGTTRNPWDLSKTPGGSSGGAAAATAAGMGVIALASDAAGSIRHPCALTGLYGLKPTFGLVPDWPPSYLGSLAVIGPIARSVRDCALALDVIARPDLRDPYAVPVPSPMSAYGLDAGIRALNLAYCPTLCDAKIDPEVAACVSGAIEVFGELAASIVEVDSPISDPTPIVARLMTAGLAEGLRQFGIARKQWPEMDPVLVQAAQAGECLKAHNLLEARRAQEELAIAMARFHETFDLLITPAIAITAFDARLEAPEGHPTVPAERWKPFSAPFNLSGQPAAAVPCGVTAEGLPVAVQIVGPRFSDALVLQAARAFETVCPRPKPDLTRLIANDSTASPIVDHAAAR